MKQREGEDEGECRYGEQGQVRFLRSRFRACSRQPEVPNHRWSGIVIGGAGEMQAPRAKPARTSLQRLQKPARASRAARENEQRLQKGTQALELGRRLGTAGARAAFTPQASAVAASAFDRPRTVGDARRHSSNIHHSPPSASDPLAPVLGAALTVVDTTD